MNYNFYTYICFYYPILSISDVKCGLFKLFYGVPFRVLTIIVVYCGSSHVLLWSCILLHRSQISNFLYNRVCSLLGVCCFNFFTVNLTFD